MNQDDDIISDYLDGDIIDPCDYSPLELERLADFLGEEPEDLF